MEPSCCGLQVFIVAMDPEEASDIAASLQVDGIIDHTNPYGIWVARLVRSQPREIWDAGEWVLCLWCQLHHDIDDWLVVWNMNLDYFSISYMDIYIYMG